MNNLSLFLAQFEVLIKTERIQDSRVKEIIQEVIGGGDISRVSLKNFGVFLETHPVIKNEVMLHKQEILARLLKETGKDFESLH